jgi:hypothetical protein
MSKSKSAPSSVMPDASTLHSTVDTMNAIATDGFTEIYTFARLALAYLEHPESSSKNLLVANALRAIHQNAMAYMNSINVEAEAVV